MSFLKQLSSIMNKRQKTSAFVLFLISLFNSFLELLGIALVAPVVTVLQARTSPTDFSSRINSDFFSKIVTKVFNIDPVIGNANKIIVIMIIIIIILYLIKAAYSILVNYFTLLFTRTLSRSLSTKLIKSNLSMPYDYFINTNSSIIIRKCTTDVDNFLSSLTGVINTMIASLTALVIFIYLMIQSWLITLAFTAFMSIAAVISVFLLKYKARQFGLKAQRFNAANFDILHRSIFGIKETKIAETDGYFANMYYENRMNFDKSSISFGMVANLPSLIIQNFGIIIVMIATILLTVFLPTERTAYIVTLLTGFVLAAVKLLPCINTISGNAVSFSSFKPSIKTIFDDLKEAEEIEKLKREKIKLYGSKPMSFAKQIELKDVTFAYISSKNIVENVNLKIKKGEYVAFSGNSGAGKTTIVDNILGLLTPQKGDIICDGRSIYQNIKSWHSLLSYVPQSIYLLDDTIKANICFGLELKGVDDKKIWKALEKAQLKEFVMSLPDKLNAHIGEAGVKLSGGQRQRIGIARAFFRDTPIIVLDEATSALDYKTEDNILENIRKVKGDKTIIIITHRLNTISHCDKIYLIENHSCTQIK